MTINKMKEILYKKLQGECSCFTKEDINISRKGKNIIEIIMDGYEHCPIELKLLYDEDEGEYFIIMNDIAYDHDKMYTFFSSYEGYPLESALITVGYYISTRF